MSGDVVAVFIPIILTLVIGAVFIIYFYLKSKEKQMLIEKGLSAEEIKKFFEEKRDGLWLMKIGIISIFFGLGIGFGMMLQDATTKEYWVPLFLFVATGIGFVVANVLADKMKKKNNS
jgi:formate/nitrite transporter FocA (FNT family)